MPEKAEYGADMWDKTVRYTPEEWSKQLGDDLAAKGESFVWTSIPDRVTEELKAMGYDGIVDRGGKMGGDPHNVAIPFEPNQIRSVNAAFDPANASSSNLMFSLGKEADDATVAKWKEEFDADQAAMFAEDAAVGGMARAKAWLKNLDLPRAKDEKSFQHGDPLPRRVEQLRNLFHGTPMQFKGRMKPGTADAVFFTPDREFANDFSNRGGGELVQSFQLR